LNRQQEMVAIPQMPSHSGFARLCIFVLALSDRVIRPKKRLLIGETFLKIKTWVRAKQNKSRLNAHKRPFEEAPCVLIPATRRYPPYDRMRPMRRPIAFARMVRISRYILRTPSLEVRGLWLRLRDHCRLFV
jgi:hypothetical protein